MKLELTDEEAELILGELDRIIENDRYFMSPRILALREIRARIKPYPQPAPAPPPQKHYEPPSKGRYRRRR